MEQKYKIIINLKNNLGKSKNRKADKAWSGFSIDCSVFGNTNPLISTDSFFECMITPELVVVPELVEGTVYNFSTTNRIVWNWKKQSYCNFLKN